MRCMGPSGCCWLSSSSYQKCSHVSKPRSQHRLRVADQNSKAFWLEFIDRFIATFLSVGHYLSKIKGDQRDTTVFKDISRKTSGTVTYPYYRREGSVASR